MNNTIEYKGYTGSIEFSEEDSIFFGKVMGIGALVSYEGQSAKELIEDFHNAVDDYLDLCAEKNMLPEKAYKGSFNVRVAPDIHKRAAVYAVMHNTSLNRFVEEALVARLSAVNA